MKRSHYTLEALESGNQSGSRQPVLSYHCGWSDHCRQVWRSVALLWSVNCKKYVYLQLKPFTFLSSCIQFNLNFEEDIHQYHSSARYRRIEFTELLNKTDLTSFVDVTQSRSWRHHVCQHFSGVIAVERYLNQIIPLFCKSLPNWNDFVFYKSENTSISSFCLFLL